MINVLSVLWLFLHQQNKVKSSVTTKSTGFHNMSPCNTLKWCTRLEKYTSQDITDDARLIFCGITVTECLHIISDNCIRTAGGYLAFCNAPSSSSTLVPDYRVCAPGLRVCPCTRLRRQYMESDLWLPANSDITNIFGVGKTRQYSAIDDKNLYYSARCDI